MLYELVSQSTKYGNLGTRRANIGGLLIDSMCYRTLFVDLRPV